MFVIENFEQQSSFWYKHFHCFPFKYVTSSLFSPVYMSLQYLHSLMTLSTVLIKTLIKSCLYATFVGFSFMQSMESLKIPFITLCLCSVCYFERHFKNLSKFCHFKNLSKFCQSYVYVLCVILRNTSKIYLSSVDRFEEPFSKFSKLCGCLLWLFL